jgi:hypothetical protein
VSPFFPAEYFFLAGFYFGGVGVILNLDKYIFPWQRFLSGGSS